MKIDDRAKRVVSELSDAVNFAIEDSTAVSDAVERLRDMGFEPNLNLRLEVGLEEVLEVSHVNENDLVPEFTEEDIQTLRRMKIKVDE